MKIIEREFNALTGETTVTERDETAQEQAEREAIQAEVAARRAEIEAAAQAKAQAEAKLAALGLTTNDLRALGL